MLQELCKTPSSMGCPNRLNDDDYRVSETDSDSGDDDDYKPAHVESSSVDCNDGDLTSVNDRPNVEEDDCKNTCKSWDELSEVSPVYKTRVPSVRNRPSAHENECNTVSNSTSCVLYKTPRSMECPNRPNDDDYRVSETDSDW